jgi:hypothetical protein
MSHIYSPPPELGEPTFDYKVDYKTNLKMEEEWVDNLRSWVKNEFGNKEYVGEIICDPVADGYAQYMIASLHPLKLIHLPIGDAWNSKWAHKWSVKDVKSMVNSQKALKEIFT